QRGELALRLPVGLVRLDDGRVVKNPDVHVQEMITLVFETFLAGGSSRKVVCSLRERGLLLPRRHHDQQTRWRAPMATAVLAILKNPAYAGAFAYGKTHIEWRGDGPPQHRRLAMEDWAVIVQDRYPAYISWDTFLHV